MNIDTRERIRKFVADEATCKIVFAFIQDVYLRPTKSKDVHVLAASRLAIDNLQEAWDEMSRFSSRKEDTITEKQQIAL